MLKKCKNKQFIAVGVGLFGGSMLILLMILFIMYLIGFRITYAPDLENSWDAVSGVASWASVLVSLVGVVASIGAIWFAVRVPKQIAERQSKIDLFEKRYKVYLTLVRCQFFGGFVYVSKKLEDMEVSFYKAFCEASEYAEPYRYQHFAEKYIEVTNKLTESKFLFPEDIWRYMVRIITGIQGLIPVDKEKMTKEDFEKAKHAYIEIMNSNEFKLMMLRIEEELNLMNY